MLDHVSWKELFVIAVACCKLGVATVYAVMELDEILPAELVASMYTVKVEPTIKLEIVKGLVWLARTVCLLEL